VYTYKDGKAHLTEVTVKDQGANYLVEKGLAMGDQYILNPDKKLKDNQEVAVFE
jgi:HlyD family secretion protein